MLKKNGLDYNRRGVLLHYAFWTQEYIHELCQHFGKRTCYRSVCVRPILRAGIRRNGNDYCIWDIILLIFKPTVLHLKKNDIDDCR